METKNLVNFDVPGDHLEDSGEGGLFAIMVVPEPEGYDTMCHVDAKTVILRPDVCVSEHRNALWEPWEHGRMTNGKAYQQLTQAGMEELARWALMTTSDHDLSLPLLASAFLGSTCHSLWNARQSAYWTAGVDDLTEQGKTLYDSLKAAYGVEPLILTFLDT